MIGNNIMQWLCFQTNSKQEFLARASLIEKGFKVLLPFYMKVVSHARKKIKKPYPIFPTYAFLQYDGDPSNLNKIKNSIGVRKYLKKTDGYPQIVSNKIIEDIQKLKQEDGSYKLDKNFLKPGDDVLIIDGVLSGIKAILNEYIDEKRTQLLINFLGRENKVNLNSGMIERA